MKYEPHEAGDVLVITGVGDAFPFIRVHDLLNAMQPEFSRCSDSGVLSGQL